MEQKHSCVLKFQNSRVWLRIFGVETWFKLNNCTDSFKTSKDIEIKQQDKYCTVKELIQFRPATYDELRQQLKLRSDSLGSEMSSNSAGYLHAKDNQSKAS